VKDLSNETMVQIQKEGASFLQFRQLKEKEPELLHGYTMKPLDFQWGEKFDQSFQTLQNAQNVKGLWIKTRQTHSDHIRVIRQEEENLPQRLDDTDGVVTNKIGLLVLTTFADCTPILIYDPKKHVIANVHSGWRGTVQMIGKKALEIMQKEFDVKPQDCIATIGPNIQACCFEVEADVQKIFAEKFSHLSVWKDCIMQKGNKYWIDTAKINKAALAQMGIPEENIVESHICTKCQADVLHSYRAEKEASGRSIMFTRLQERR